MTNPFVYGEIVPAAAFVDREAELDRLGRRPATPGQKIFLISPRRYGKSSLVRQALTAPPSSGALTVEVTVSSYSSYVAFLEGYARALVVGRDAARPGASWLRDMLVRRPARGPDRARRARARPDRGRVPRRPHRARRVAPRAGGLRAARTHRRGPAPPHGDRARRVPGASASFNGGSVEHALRAAVQHQRQVGYVFSGSEPTLMERMLGQEPAVLQGRTGHAPAEDSRPTASPTFIEARFKATRLSSRRRASAPPSSSSPGNLPYDVQRLAHEVWDDVRADGGRSADLDDLHATLKRLLGEHETLFEGTWQRLTLAQRAALRAACSRTAASCCRPTSAPGIG